MGEQDTGETFGCDLCWPASADAAWNYRRTLTCEAGLIDESHFHVMVLACPGCSQRFVSIFTENIDWTDGDDPQYWAVLPVTEAEAASLIRQRGSLSERELNSLGPGRRCLHRDYPKGEEPCCYWGAGLSVRGHD